MNDPPQRYCRLCCRGSGHCGLCDPADLRPRPAGWRKPKCARTKATTCCGPFRAHVAALLLDAEITWKPAPRDRDGGGKALQCPAQPFDALTEGPQLRYMSELGLADNLVAAEKAIRAVGADILGLSTATSTPPCHPSDSRTLDRGSRPCGNPSMVRQWRLSATTDRQRESITGHRLDLRAHRPGVVLSCRHAAHHGSVSACCTSSYASGRLPKPIAASLRSLRISSAFPLAVIDPRCASAVRSHDGTRRLEAGMCGRGSWPQRTDRCRADVVRLDAGQVSADPPM